MADTYDVAVQSARPGVDPETPAIDDSLDVLRAHQAIVPSDIDLPR